MKPSDYLKWVHGCALERKLDAYVALTAKEPTGLRTVSVHLTELDKINELVDTLGDLDLYVRGQLLDEPVNGTRRGTGDLSGWITHLAADVDYAGGAHSASNLPTVVQARQLIDATLLPSAVISSGGGFYAVWRLERPLRLTDDRAEFVDLGQRIDQALNSHGFHVDRVTSDVARILRLPGSLNHKYDPPRPVTVDVYRTRSYTPGELANRLPELAPPPPTRTVTTAGNGDSWASIFARRHTLADVLAHDPVDTWSLMDVTSKWERWRRSGSTNDYSLKQDRETGVVFVMSSTVQARLGVTGQDALTLYRFACLVAGVDEHRPQDAGGGALDALLLATYDERKHQHDVDLHKWAEPSTSSTPQETSPLPELDDGIRRHHGLVIPTPLDWTTISDTDLDVEWLVEGFWVRGTGVHLHAPAKTGKSLLALWIAAHLARGLDPFTGTPRPPVTVAYLDYEMTRRNVAQRLADMDLPLAELGNLRYYLYPNLGPLDTANGGKHLHALVDADRPDVVIFDTMSRIVEGAENDADTTQALYAHSLARLKALGVSWLRLDHEGYNNARQRGTSAKTEDVDVVWRLQRAEHGGLLLTKRMARDEGYDEKIPLESSDTPLTYRRTKRAEPVGALERAALLDRLDAPLDISKAKARELLKANGITPGRNDVLVAALRLRRELPAHVIDALDPSRGPVGDRSDTPSGTAAGTVE